MTRLIRTTIFCAMLGGGIGAAGTVSAAQVEDSTPPMKGTSVASTANVSGKIVKIDKSKRSVTIKGDDGVEKTVTAPSEMTRFDELKVGDRVNVSYYESVAVALAPPGTPLQKSTTATGQTGGPGQPPAGAAARQTTATVKIVSIDHSANTVTFKGPSGKVQTVSVDEPAMQQRLADAKPGEVFQIVYTEAVAAAINPQQ